MSVIIGRIKGEKKIKMFSQWGERITDLEGKEYKLSEVADDFIREDLDEALGLIEKLNWEQKYCKYYQCMCKNVLASATHCEGRDCEECEDCEYLEYSLRARAGR